MPLHLGPGPVFVYEWLTASRRWQPYAVRAGFVGVVLIGMALAWSGTLPAQPRGGVVSLRDLARFGETLFWSLAWIDLTLILLVAPAATAGAICLDKARGTLDHMLATDLSNAEIVLGKLGARLIPMLGLIAATLPVLALASLMGGIAPMALAGLFLTAIGCAVLACSLTMVLSIYGRKTHEVVIAAYILLIGWVVAPLVLEMVMHAMSGPFPPPPPPGGRPAPPPPGPPGWLVLLHELFYQAHPYILALAPYLEPAPPDEARYLGFLGGCLAASAAMVVLAIARVRRVAMKQAGRPAAGGRRRRRLGRVWLPGPSLDRNPVAWREWHRGRSSRMMAIAWGGYAALGLIWVGLTAWSSSRGWPGDHLSVAFANMGQESIGLLLLGAGAAASLAEERARGSLDVLLSTPMPTRSILAGKWWGGSRPVLAVAIWPAATAAILAYHQGSWIGPVLLIGLVLAHGAAIASLGLVVATWVGRPGRAIGVCAVAIVLFGIGWPILLGLGLTVLGNLGINVAPTLVDALLVGDPPFGVWFATIATSASGAGTIEHGSSRGGVLLWVSGWTVAHAVAAAALFAAAVATFDGCLGRIPDDGMAPPRPRGRSSLSADELLALVPTSAEEP